MTAGSIVKKLNSLLMIGILLSLSTIGIITTISPLSGLQRASTSVLSLSPHDPIYIVGNSGFVLEGWSGNGTKSSPYIIESLEIVSEGTCITIRNSDAHFIIRNCTLSSPILGVGTGVFLTVVDNGVVENCTISSLETGIETYLTNDCIITNNTIINCRSHGLDLSKDFNCTINDNMVMDHSGYGLYVGLQEFSHIENNSISHCEEMGFALVSSIDTTIVENKIEESGRFGLYIAGSSNCTFTNNTLENGGYGVGWNNEAHWINNFSGNVINGKSLGYFIRTNNIEIDGSQFGQVFLVDCFNVSLRSGVFFNASVGVSLFSCTNCTIDNTEITGNLYGVNVLESEATTLTNNALVNCGVRFDGADIRYWTIDASGNTVNGKLFGYFLNQENFVIDGNDYGQLILVDSNHLSITNGTFDSVTVGFVAYSCINCSVEDASFVDNYLEGISLLGSNNCTFTNVTSEGSRGKGFRLSASNYTIVTESEIHENGDSGIWVYGSDDFLFDSNQIYDNRGSPIYLSGTNYGMIRNNSMHDNRGRLRLYVVNWLEIINNTISGSSSDGIYMDFTSGVVIVGNKIYGNTGYGLNVRTYALFSEIYNNMFGFNEAGNAYDNGLFSEWDDGISMGNVWSDYSGEGVYSISGLGVDAYPLGFLTWQEDIQYVIGSSVPPVTWDVRLPNPDSYTLLWDGTTIVQSSLNSSLDHITRSIEGLSVDVYNLTLVVIDESGYSMIDTVIITVTEEPVTTTTTTTTTTTETTTTTSTTSTTETTSSTASTTPTSPPPSDNPMTLIIVAVGIVGAIVILLLFVIRKK